MTQNAALIVLTAMSAVVAFFPLMGTNDRDQMEDSLLKNSLASRGFRESSYVILGLGFTSLFMQVMDAVGDKFSAAYVFKRHAKFLEKERILTIGEMFLYFAGTLIVPCVATLPLTSPTLALTYLCATQAQIILLYGYVLAFAARYYHKYFPQWAVALSAVIFYGSALLWPWAENRADPQNASSDHLVNILVNIEWAGVSVFMVFIMRWLYCELLLKLVLPRCVCVCVPWFGESPENRSQIPHPHPHPCPRPCIPNRHNLHAAELCARQRP